MRRLRALVALPATHVFPGLAKKDVDARSAVAKTRLCPDMTNGKIEYGERYTAMRGRWIG